MADVIKREALIGMPVICATNGKKLGIVADVLFNPLSRKMEGITVVKNGLNSKNIDIPMHKIRTIGEAAVIVEEEVNHKTSARGNNMREGSLNGSDILGRSIISDDGEAIGIISDIVFNPADGSVEGYELSRGFIDDLIDGRDILPINNLNPMAGDVIIVSVEQTSNIVSSNGGIRNIITNKVE